MLGKWFPTFRGIVEAPSSVCLAVKEWRRAFETPRPPRPKSQRYISIYVYNHTRSVRYRAENPELPSWLFSPSVHATDVALLAQLASFRPFNLWATDSKQSGALTYLLSSILTSIKQKPKFIPPVFRNPPPLGFYAAKNGSYRHFGKTYRFQHQFSSSPRIVWPLKMGPRGCPETSAANYHSTLRKIAEEYRSHWRGGGSLKSRSSFPLYKR
jgi:hypothetical protein